MEERGFLLAAQQALEDALTTARNNVEGCFFHYWSYLLVIFIYHYQPPLPTFTPFLISTLLSQSTTLTHHLINQSNIPPPSPPLLPTVIPLLTEAVVRQALDAHASMSGPEPLPTDDDVTIVVKVQPIKIQPLFIGYNLSFYQALFNYG